MNIIYGISIFEAIAQGTAFVITDGGQTGVPKYAVAQKDAGSGWERFLAACQKIKNNLDVCIADAAGEERLILETHRMMIADTIFLDDLHALYTQSSLNIEYVLSDYTNASAKKLVESGNPLLAERADDILDVFGKVLRELLCGESFDPAHIPEGAIIVARKLSPSDAVMVFKRHPAGLCLAEGGSGGHLAILTRSAHIPAVFAAKDAHTLIQTGDSVVIDGRNARVYVAPDAKTAGSFRDGLQKQVVFRQKLSSLKNEPCLTKDGKKITLFANIGSPEEALTALDEGAEGIGLFRTEFLFMATETARREQCMSEDTQFEAYKSVLCIMKKKPVVIRTLDAGGDKFLTATGKDFDAAENPLLGQRSVRLSLARPDIFKVQLRALFRAGVYGNLRIMLPLVINSGEVQAVFSLIREVKKELTLENIPFKKNIPVGIMVETPAAALSSDVFARLCRFFSIGTNDLTQYTLAVDREDTAVSGLFNEFHCAVLRLIKTTLVNAQIAGIPVCVCGELAGMPEGAAVLAGMGIDTLSMTAFSIPKIKYFLSLFSSHDLELIAEEAVAAKRNTDNRTSLHALHFRQAAALCKKVLLP